MSGHKMNWAIPVMRFGYAGRGVTYVAIAGLSLWGIWHGGEAQGTQEVLQAIETSPFGMIVLLVIGVGLLCYTFWRLLDGISDLEDEGSDGKGMIARAGMIITGLIHGALGIAALALIAGRSNGGGGDSRLVKATETIMGWPFGPMLVILGGLATIGAGIYYFHKAWKQTYRSKLQGNHFTTHWNTVLRYGVAAQAVVVTIVGGFFVYAGWTHDPDEAGGLAKTFDWLSGQVYGQVLVTLLCLGLLGFAMFLFVNARYRIIPRLSDPDIRTLKQALN